MKKLPLIGLLSLLLLTVAAANQNKQPAAKGAVADDTAALQAKITAAGVGGTITLDRRVYTLRGQLVLLDKQTLVIPSGATLQRAASGVNSLQLILLADKTGCTITGGGTLDGNKRAHRYTINDIRCFGVYVQGGGDHTIADLTIQNMSGTNGSYGSGVYLNNNPAGVTIRDCLFDANTRNGIETHGAEHLRVTGCTFRRAISEGYNDQADGTDGQGINLELNPEDVGGRIVNVQISGNTFTENIAGLTANNRRGADAFRNMLLTGNLFTKSKSHGLHGGGWGSGCRIVDNVFDGNGGAGASLSGCAAGLAIQDNTCHGNGLTGLSLYGCSFASVTGNHLTRNGQHGCTAAYGIQPDPSGPAQPLYLTFTNNQCWNNGTEKKEGRHYAGLSMDPFASVPTKALIANNWFGNNDQFGKPTQHYGWQGKLYPRDTQLTGNGFEGNITAEANTDWRGTW